MYPSLTASTALVTGAASGIGRAIAHELARRGARLILVDIDREGLAQVASTLRAGGASVRTFGVDLADADAVRVAAHDAEADAPIDLLFNNAGIALAAPLVATSTEDWERIVGINLWGPIRLTQALLPAMLRRGRGRLVFTASIAGLIGAPGMVAYSTTKFAIVGFAEALRHEIADRGVHVTVACPGYVRTNLAKATRYRNDGFERFLAAPPRWYGSTAKVAATRIVRATLAGEHEVVFGLERLGWWIKRASPRAAHRVTSWVARTAGVVGREGSVWA